MAIDLTSYEGEWEYVWGVVRWKANGAVPPEEVLARMEADGVITHGIAERARQVSYQEAKAHIAAYQKRRAEQGYSSEERAEMRAAYGAGAEVYDILTGETFTV